MEITSLSQLDSNRTYSYADYYQWKIKERVELIKGKLFPMSPAPSPKHQLVGTALSALVWDYFRRDSC